MKLTVASSPHIRGNFRTNRIMYVCGVFYCIIQLFAICVVTYSYDKCETFHQMIRR